MSDLAAAKAAARKTALAVRAAAHAEGMGAARRVAGRVLAKISGLKTLRRVSAYFPIGTELDSLPAMLALHGLGIGLCVPVTQGRGRPLAFREWTPDAALVDGPFGVQVPAEGATVVPDVLLVPLLAFDAAGYRLGYGGGYYDRTLASLRAEGEVLSLGIGYAAQQVEAVPRESFDARLDAVITEAELIRPA